MNERPVEYTFALQALADLKPQTILDIGSGRSAWPALLADCGYQVTAIDKWTGYWRRPWTRNPHFRVNRDDITQPHTRGPFDVITCISALEHIADHQAAVTHMLGLAPYVIITCPYNEAEYIFNAYDLAPDYWPGAPCICQQFSRAEIDAWTQGRARLICQQYWQVFTGQYWGQGERIPPRHVPKTHLHHLTGLVIAGEQRKG